MFTLEAPWLIICTLIPFFAKAAKPSAKILLVEPTSQIIAIILIVIAIFLFKRKEK